MITTDELVPVILVMNDEYFLPYCLEAVKGRFERYVIYDVGSEDKTKDIIEWFIDTSPEGTEFLYRILPPCPPSVQGTFRNSMIAETMSDWYFILDGDEIYTPESMDALIKEMENMKELYISKKRTYGIARRVEITNDMKSAYGQSLMTPHHRVYHRRMIFSGPHPGEAPFFEQKRNNEHWFSKKVICYHMHNCDRSPLDEDVPKRLQRRGRPTYRPGEYSPFDLFERIPILKTPIEDFAVSPTLASLQQKADA
jgi:glycosyltransferase involved in cell wall biosynthesis